MSPTVASCASVRPAACSKYKFGSESYYTLENTIIILEEAEGARASNGLRGHRCVLFVGCIRTIILLFNEKQREEGNNGQATDCFKM